MYIYTYGYIIFVYFFIYYCYIYIIYYIPTFTIIHYANSMYMYIRMLHHCHRLQCPCAWSMTRIHSDGVQGHRRALKRSRSERKRRSGSPERIIQQHDVRARVGGACQRDTRLLAARQVDPALTELGLVARGKMRDVPCQGRGLHRQLRPHATKGAGDQGRSARYSGNASIPSYTAPSN